MHSCQHCVQVSTFYTRSDIRYYCFLTSANLIGKVYKNLIRSFLVCICILFLFKNTLKNLFSTYIFSFVNCTFMFFVMCTSWEFEKVLHVLRMLNFDHVPQAFTLVYYSTF